MGDSRSAAGISGSNFSVGGIHTPKSDAPAGEAWIYTIVYVFRLEEYEMGADAIFHGDDSAAVAGIRSIECVAEHSGYSDRVFTIRRAAGVYGAADFGGHSQRELWNLRSCI